MITAAEKRALIKTIDRQQLREALAHDPRPKLVMTMNEWAFRAKHIPGSLSFHSSAQMFAALAKDDAIVVYCSNVDCHASVAAAVDLMDHGYTQVRHYAGGLLDWEEGGLPLEGEWVEAAPSA